MYQGHTLEKTYLGEDFFWAITPTAGDYVLFKFDRPVSIERYALCQGGREGERERERGFIGMAHANPFLKSQCCSLMIHTQVRVDLCKQVSEDQGEIMRA